jgi:hypothetical protein
MLLMGDGVHSAAIALLGQYSAASFTAASDGHDGTLLTFVNHAQTTMPVGGQSPARLRSAGWAGGEGMRQALAPARVSAAARTPRLPAAASSGRVAG